MEDKFEYFNWVDQLSNYGKKIYDPQLLEQVKDLMERGITTDELFQELHLQNEKALINLSVDTEAEKVPLHSHTFYEVVFVLQGKVNYLVNTHRYQLQKGDIVVIPPGVCHQPLIFEALQEPYRRFSLWLDTTYIEEAFMKYPEAGIAFNKSKEEEQYLVRMEESIWRNLRMSFDHLYKESCERRPGWQLCIALKSLELAVQIGRVYYNRNTIELKRDADSMLESMLVYIDVNLQEKITLESIAHAFLVSKSTVSHLFQQQIGVSFYQCVLQRRLLAAKNAILQGVPMHEVSEACGFAEYSSFYRLFKKEYGISPREYLALHPNYKRG